MISSANIKDLLPIVAYVKQSISLFPAHLSVCITEDESNGREEVAFPGTIAPNDDIVLR